MKQIAEALDDALTYAMAYPTTMFYVLVYPRAAFDEERRIKPCPPALSLVVSLAALFIGNRVLLRIQTADDSIPLVPEIGDININVLLSVAVVMLLVQLIILTAVLPRRPDRDSGADVRALAYPIAAAFLAVPIITILCIYFPGVTKTIAVMLESMDSEAQPSKYQNSFIWQVNTLQTFGAMLVYVVALFNVVRVKFARGIVRSIGVTVGILILSVFVAVALFFLHDRMQEQMKHLSMSESSFWKGQGDSQPDSASGTLTE